MLTDDQFFNLLLWFFVLRSRSSIPHQHDSRARKFRTSASHRRMISRDYDEFFLLFIGKAELLVDESVHSRYQKAFHKMSSCDCMGLYLSWTRLRGTTVPLQMIFGMPATSVAIYLKFSRRILIHILSRSRDAAIKIPSAAKIMEYQRTISAKHPRLKDVWCTMDGLKIYLEQSGDPVTQNRFYNGWTCDHYVSAVLVFCPDGTIPIAAYNAPGSFHDSTIAEWGNIYEKLRDVYENTGTGGKCTVDSAFSQKRHQFLIKSSQADPLSNDPAALAVNREATSMRQSAEWGMRAIQASFPRLEDCLTYEEFGEQSLIMKSMLLLYNLRARKVGINQILNTYMPALQRDANSLF